MKKPILIIILVLAAGGGLFYYLMDKGILGGKNISEGVIEYDITYPKMDPNDMMVGGLPNKAYLRFKNNNMVNDMSGMMGLISITYISKQDKSAAQTLTLFNNRYLADISSDDMKRINADYVQKVEEGKNSQTIAGFKCKEAIATLKNGEMLHVYYTNEISISNPNWSNPFTKIDGVLMDFEMERYGLAMHLKAKKVLAEKVDDNSFVVSETDYKKISFPELEKILAGLTGGS